MNSRVVSEYESLSVALSSAAAKAESIAQGLENAAPASASAATGSVHYLHAIASQLELEGEALMPKGAGADVGKSYEALTDLARKIIKQDADLREKYLVGDRFRFVRDRLQELLHYLEGLVAHEAAALLAGDSKPTEETWTGQPVYVYLYNAQGAILRTWTAMLTSRAFYEYSVNRPVYGDKKAVEDIIALKSNPLQHAYMTVSIRPEDITAKENVVIKVREGALLIERLVTFTHNGQEFTFDRGELVKKI